MQKTIALKIIFFTCLSSRDVPMYGLFAPSGDGPYLFASLTSDDEGESVRITFPFLPFAFEHQGLFPDSLLRCSLSNTSPTGISSIGPYHEAGHGRTPKTRWLSVQPLRTVWLFQILRTMIPQSCFGSVKD
jgi:hypothetical protein